jgi:hypothetical protein
VLSGWLSFAGVAYIIGWFEARAYFSAFDAGWLVTQLSAADLLRFSWVPITLLAFFMWVGLSDLARASEGIQSKRFRNTQFIVNHGWILLLLLIVTYALEALGYVVAADLLASITMIGYVLFAGAVFEAIVMFTRQGLFVGDLVDAQLVYAVVFAGLYLVPTLYGSAEGRSAADQARSELPVVHSGRAAGQDLRLLLLAQGTVYAAQLGGTTSKPTIYVLPISEVQTIAPKPGSGPVGTPGQAGPKKP